MGIIAMAHSPLSPDICRGRRFAGDWLAWAVVGNLQRAKRRCAGASGSADDPPAVATGESIRTPRMTALFWGGDATRAVNMWRRWYLSHILPKPNGQPMQPHVACAASDEGEEFTAATEENQIRFMDSFRQQGIDFDVWWIDTGCIPAITTRAFAAGPSPALGSRTPNAFPDRLKPISDHAARNNADLLLWFETGTRRPRHQARP